jgi:hypothetical protein
VHAADAPGLKVADLGWIGVALLHREQPERESFRVKEIIAPH